MKRSTVTEDVIGKWPGVLSALAVDRSYLVNRHGPCPLCEGGRDRFRFDDKDGKGSWFCSQCGAGDGWSLLMKLKGWDFKRAAQEVEAVVGTAKLNPVKRGRDEAVVRAEMNALWLAGKPLERVSATAIWWVNRTGEIPQCRDLRAVESAICPREGRFPAMIALIRDAEGAPANLHRTFLTAKGDKAPVDAPRRLMDMPMPKGSAVRLGPVDVPRMGVAEGLETAVAASILHGLPVWATINAVNLESFVPPDGVREVIVFGDNDKSATGQHISWGLVRRLRRHGINAWPEFPETEGEDWDDVLMRQLGHGVAA